MLLTNSFEEKIAGTVFWDYYNKFNDVFNYVRNRFFRKYYLVDTKLPKGNYYDSDTLLLHSMFSILEDYVEIELSALYYFCHENEKNPNWFIRKFTRYKSDKGLQYLDLVIDDPVTPRQQLKDSIEIKKLYIWWKQIRPNRPDPYVAAGYYDVFDKSGVFLKKKLTRAEKSVFTKIARIEKRYLTEDHRMMCRLVKVSPSLWT
jgi:hypothetical protein